MADVGSVPCLGDMPPNVLIAPLVTDQHSARAAGDVMSYDP